MALACARVGGGGMSKTIQCPVCLGKHSASATGVHVDTHDIWSIDCEACGRFRITSEARDDFLSPNDTRATPLKRAALSHAIRGQQNQKPPVLLMSAWVERFFEESARLPTPAEQAANLVRFVGDMVQETGEQMEQLPLGLYAIVGASNPLQAKKIVQGLIDSKLLTAKPRPDANAPTGGGYIWVDLTLAGWQRYEQEKRGRFAGNYGFIALKFGDSILDPFLSNHVKPGIKTHIGYDLIDMRDAAKAGIIDNLMREKIRDAAFVLVDLTHENSGAYWEAGYAEGLGKPVLYICERTKFVEAKTHFDTNHLTTVLWEADKPAEFIEQLVATLRRSLNLFPTTKHY
jgi:nucleoside 2-deoxyribosyltransferase